MHNIPKELIAKFSRTNQATYLKSRMPAINEKFKNDTSQIIWKYSSQQTIQGHSLILNLLELNHEYLMKYGKLIIESMSISIDRNKIINRDVEHRLTENLYKNVGNLHIRLQQKLAMQKKRYDLGPTEHAISMKESSKWINTMNILQHQLKERVILYNENSKAKDLLTKVQNNAKLLFDASKDIDFSFIKNTKKILVKHPEAEKLFNEALDKYVNGIYQRNLLDDMRLALELFLKSFFKNNKSLENQKSAIGVYQEESNASKELSNMFNKLVEYYAKYHNEHVKHNDKVIQKEIGFVINLTTCFIMYFN